MKPLIKALLTLSLLLLFLQFFRDDLVFQRDAINHGQWWRLFTGNLVHANFPHLALNLAGLWIAGFLFMDFISARAFLLNLSFLISCVALGIYYFSPELSWYAGLSGALYGLFLVGAVYCIINRDYLTGIPIIALVPVKIIWDLLHGGSQSSAELIGVPVATDAHLYGMMGAIIPGLYLVFFHSRVNLLKCAKHNNKKS